MELQAAVFSCMREGDLAGVFPFFVLLCGFSVFGFVFHHLDFVLSGAAVFRFGSFAASDFLRF